MDAVRPVRSSAVRPLAVGVRSYVITRVPCNVVVVVVLRVRIFLDTFARRHVIIASREAVTYVRVVFFIYSFFFFGNFPT